MHLVPRSVSFNPQMLAPRAGFKKSLALGFAAASFAFALTGFASAAEACRDCPFPMKVGEGRWLMPNGQIEITIEETKAQTPAQQMTVTLIEPKTGKVLAKGTARSCKEMEDVSISLTDSDGRPVQGQIHFVDGSRETIQAKFTCDACSIADLIQ